MATSVNGVIPAGAPAPAFELPLLGGGVAAVPDRAAKGHTLVVFYKMSCPTCRLTLPFLQRLHDQVSPAGGRVMAISQDGMEGAASFARELGLTIPIMVDTADYRVSSDYDLVAVPTLYLIDRRGAILRSGAGFSRRELGLMAEELAASVAAPEPVLFGEQEEVPDFKPG